MNYTFVEKAGKFPKGSTVKHTKKFGFRVYGKDRKLIGNIEKDKVANYIEEGLLRSDVESEEIEWDMTEAIPGYESLEKAKNSYLRDQFAMAALPAVYSGARDKDSLAYIADKCYEMADEMMKSRG